MAPADTKGDTTEQAPLGQRASRYRRPLLRFQDIEQQWCLECLNCYLRTLLGDVFDPIRIEMLRGQATQRKTGLGLRIPIDYSDYSLEHLKKNHGEKQWTGYISTRVPGRCPPDSTRCQWQLHTSDRGPTGAISDTTCKRGNNLSTQQPLIQILTTIAGKYSV